MQLFVRQIVRDPDLQVRAAFTEKKAEEYAAQRRKGSKGPRVVVFHWQGTYLLVSGFHRVRSMELAGDKSCEAFAIDGDRRAALFFASQSNREHDGVGRTDEDKRRAVLMMLDDPEWGDRVRWPNARVAEHCGVSPSMVAKWRQERLEALKRGQGENLQSGGFRLGASGIGALAAGRKARDAPAAAPADATAAEHARWRPTWLREAREGLEAAVRCAANLGDDYRAAGLSARNALDELEAAALKERQSNAA